jgi:hypothetical protein
MTEWTVLDRIQTHQATQIDLREWLRLAAEGLLEIHRRLEAVERKTGLAQPK